MDFNNSSFGRQNASHSSLTELQVSQAECENLRKELGRARSNLENCKSKFYQLKELALKKVKSLEEYARSLESRLERWKSVEDADAEAKKIKEQSTREAEKIHSIAKEYLARAEMQAEQIRASAKVDAELMEADAAKSREEKDKYERLITAIKNEIRGYGDEYIIPSHTLLDELAEDIGYSEAGKQLKIARQRVKDLVKRGAASKCSYVERYRRETAMRFVADAFNGKVESALAKVKSTNYGKLKQEILDAFEIVNGNGEAFRDARITQEFLQARLDELNAACTAHEIKLQEAAEQRRIKEQIREEQKAKKEYEKALREAEKEEKAIKKLEAEIRQQMEKEANEERRRLAQASAKEREQLERQFAELKAKKDGELADIRARMEEIEERGKRACSMAQQTKKGHVYIISNIGSFGEHVYKIGLTRRLNPSERVKELGDSSVPFSFDIHALIEADDAPALEHQLHKQFALQQVNKANHRKEFFRCDIATIRAEVDKLGLETTWTMSADAQEYRETLAIEERIAKDSAASEKWINRQLELEDLEEELDDRLMSVSA